jgi:hypothetical protein
VINCSRRASTCPKCRHPCTAGNLVKVFLATSVNPEAQGQTQRELGRLRSELDTLTFILNDQQSHIDTLEVRNGEFQRLVAEMTANERLVF